MKYLVVLTMPVFLEVGACDEEEAVQVVLGQVEGRGSPICSWWDAETDYVTTKESDLGRFGVSLLDYDAHGMTAEVVKDYWKDVESLVDVVEGEAA